MKISSLRGDSKKVPGSNELRNKHYPSHQRIGQHTRSLSRGQQRSLELDASKDKGSLYFISKPNRGSSSQTLLKILNAKQRVTKQANEDRRTKSIRVKTDNKSLQQVYGSVDRPSFRSKERKSSQKRCPSKKTLRTVGASKDKKDDSVIIDDHIAKSGSQRIKFSFRSKQGVHPHNAKKINQDSLLIKCSQERNLFAIADGHGVHGHFVSQAVIKSLQKHFSKLSNDTYQISNKFQQTYTKIQEQMQQQSSFNATCSGTTLISLCIDQKQRAVCANVGDSRAILARQVDWKNWEIIHLSEDHKPSLEKQKKRILKKGGKIYCFRDEKGRSVGPQRVWLPNEYSQGLAMSRSLGDNVSKPFGVTHEPQIISIQLQPSDRFILLASDGVWEFLRNLQILQLIVPYYKKNKLEECCDALLKLAYSRWTIEDCSVVDDITFILIFLNSQQ